MWFDSWSDLLRILLVGVSAYVGLIVILRATGKRTLSKMNAFDLVVTVALGSTLASGLLDSSVSLSESLMAFALLTGLQYLIAFASVRSARVSNLVKAEPSLLAWQGRLLHDAMRRERVTRDEILAAVRGQGRASLASVHAVILETDGSFSVIGPPEDGIADALHHVRDWNAGRGPA